MLFCVDALLVFVHHDAVLYGHSALLPGLHPCLSISSLCRTVYTGLQNLLLCQHSGPAWRSAAAPDSHTVAQYVCM